MTLTSSVLRMPGTCNAARLFERALSKSIHLLQKFHKGITVCLFCFKGKSTRTANGFSATVNGRRTGRPPVGYHVFSNCFPCRVFLATVFECCADQHKSYPGRLQIKVATSCKPSDHLPGDGGLNSVAVFNFVHCV